MNFLKHNAYSYLVWVNSQPWIGEEVSGEDSWTGHGEVRREIANFISDNGIRNLFSIAGDAHMAAIDDGSNSDYSDDGVAGFPIFHAAALDRPGSAKGGPYSEGCFGFRNWHTQQYGYIEIEDGGSIDTSCLTMKAFRELETTPLVTFRKCGAIVIKGEGGNGSCEIQVMPIWGWVLVIGNLIGTGIFIPFVILLFVKKHKIILGVMGILTIVLDILLVIAIFVLNFFAINYAIISLSTKGAYMILMVTLMLAYPTGIKRE